jgi:ketosteroid isomerase-like protein
MKTLTLRMPLAAAILAAPLLASCYADTGGTAQPAVDTAAEAQSIMALEREWSSKFGEGDIDYIMSIHSANAVQMPPESELVAGAEALRAAWQGMIDTPGLSASWEPTEAHVSSSGDMAYDFGTATLTTPDGNVQAMKYLVVWVREDGEWKVAVDMFNANEAPAKE